jgi:serine/threonine protein kinase
MQLYCEECKIAVSFEDDGNGQLTCPECGHEVDRASMPPGSVIQGFKIDYEIGRGTSGAVYKAKQLNLDRDIALKVLHHEVSSDDEFVERFFREARAAASLSSPYIVQAIDAGAAEGGIYYFAMELIEGENLEEEISRSGRLSDERGLEIALIVAHAMEYAWERKKLTHGDIKPENILVNQHGEAKLADLGLAKIGNDGSDELMATPMYAPPEVISGEMDKVGMVSDIYSFGATVYHMFAGHPPFQEDDSEKVMDMHLYEQHIPLTQLGDFFSQELSDLVDKMLEKDCANRPATWTEIVKALEKLHPAPRRSLVSMAKPKTPPPPPKKQGSAMSTPAPEVVAGSASNSKRNVLIALAVALFAGIITVVAFFMLSGKDDSTAQNANGAIDAVKSQNPVAERWVKLKKELEGLDDDKIIIAIKAFTKRYKPSGAVKREIARTMLAVKERLDEQQAKLLAEKRQQQAVRDEYLASVKALLVSIAEVQPGSNHEAFQLRDLKTEVTKAVKRNVDDKFVAGSLDKKILQDLQAGVGRLDGRMKIMAARKILINKKSEILHRELNRRLALQQKMNVIGKVAGATAAYYELLNRVVLGLKNGNDVTPLLVAGRKLKLDRTQRTSLNIITKMLKDNGDIRKFFANNEGSFVGLTIPGLRGREASYKINKIKVSHLTLLRPMGGALMGYNKKWSSIGDISKFALAVKGIENSKVPVSSKDDIYLIFGWLLRNKLFEQIDELLTKSKTLSKNNRVAVVRVVNDIKRAVLERAAWSVLQKMLVLEKQQNPEIIKLIFDMTIQYAGTECYKKNRQVIEMLKQRYAGYARNRNLIKMFKYYIKIRKRNLPLAINLTATMSARFAMPKENQKRVEKVKRSLFVNIAKNKTIEAGVPFLKWNLEQLGAAIKKVNSNRRGGRGAVSQAQLSAEVDTGLWYSANIANQANDNKLFNGDNRRRYNSEESFATMFGLGVIAYRFGEFEKADEILQQMIESVGLTEALNVVEESTEESADKKAEESADKKSEEKIAPKDAKKVPPANIPPGAPPVPPVDPGAAEIPPPSELFPDEHLPPEARAPQRRGVAPARAREVKVDVTDSVKIERRMVMEYAMLIKHYSIAASLGKGHFVSLKKATVLDVNIAMLHLLAIIQSSKINPVELFELQLTKYDKLFGEKFADDIALCKHVGEILKGKRFNSAIIKKLQLCKASDAGSRMLSAAIACSVFYGNKPYPLVKFADGIKKNVSDAFGSGALWRSLLLLRLADPANSLLDMNRAIVLYKQDRRVVAVYGYPELMMFDAGVEILNDTLPLKMILARMSKSLNASPVSGLQEKIALKMMTKFNMPQLEKYLRELKPEQQPNFSLLFLGLMRLINENPADAVEFIRRNKSILFKFELSWEEKLMIDNMMLWAIAWRQENVKP